VAEVGERPQLLRLELDEVEDLVRRPSQVPQLAWALKRFQTSRWVSVNCGCTGHCRATSWKASTESPAWKASKPSKAIVHRCPAAGGAGLPASPAGWRRRIRPAQSTWWFLTILTWLFLETCPSRTLLPARVPSAELWILTSTRAWPSRTSRYPASAIPAA